MQGVFESAKGVCSTGCRVEGRHRLDVIRARASIDSRHVKSP